MTIKFVNVGPAETFEASGNYNTNPTDIDTLFQSLHNSGSDGVRSYILHSRHLCQL